jgi:hypothetical protein
MKKEWRKRDCATSVMTTPIFSLTRRQYIRQYVLAGKTYLGK